MFNNRLGELSVYNFLLPEFNLAKIIEEYNRQNSVMFPHASTFQCPYFRELVFVNASIKKVNRVIHDLNIVSPETLIEIAEDTPNLIKYFINVNRRFKKSTNKAPIAIQKAYKIYVQTFLDKAIALRQVLAQSMLAQLQTYIEQSTDSKEALTATQLNYYHNYIHNVGSESQQQALQELPWLSQREFALEKTPIGYQLVPKLFSSLIPARSGFWEAFNKGTHYRLSFFKYKAALFIMLSQLPSAESLETPLNDTAGLQHYTKQLFNSFHQIELYQTTIQSEEKQFSSLFHRKTRQFLLLWQGWLEQQRSTILDQQLTLAFKLLDTLNTQRETNTSKLVNVVYYWKQGELLRTLLSNLASESASFNISQQRQFKLLKNQWEQFATAHAGFALLQQFSQSGLEEEQLQTLKQSLEDLYQSDQEGYQAFLQVCQPEINDCLKQFEINLKRHPFSYTSLTEAEEHLKRQSKLFSFLEQLPGNATHEKLAMILDKKLSKYFLHYFECMQALTQACIQRKLKYQNPEYIALNIYCQQLENHLLQLARFDGRAVLLSDQSPLELIQNMQQLREERAWRTLGVKAETALESLLREEQWIEKRFDKEMALLEGRLQDQLHQNATLQCETWELNTVQKVMRLLTEQQSVEINTITDQLTSYDNSVIDYHANQGNAVLPLIQACVQVQLAQQKVKDSNLSCYDKTTLVKFLGQQLTQTFHQNNSNKKNTALIKTTSGKPFFSKTYLEAELVLPQSNLTKTH